jgi:hypothetical protein
MSSGLSTQRRCTAAYTSARHWRHRAQRRRKKHLLAASRDARRQTEEWGNKRHEERRLRARRSADEGSILVTSRDQSLVQATSLGATVLQELICGEAHASKKEASASTCLLSNSAPRSRADAGQKKQSAGRNRKKNRSDRQKKW